MRAIFYLAIVIAAFFISSFEARHLKKRTGTDVVGGLLSGAGGEPLRSVAGVAGGVVTAISQQTQLGKKKERGLLGGLNEGSDKKLAEEYNVKSDIRSKTARDREIESKINE